MALEAEKRNLLIFFAVLACILIGTQLFSYNKLTTKQTIQDTTITGAQNRVAASFEDENFLIFTAETTVVSWSGHAGQFGDLGRKDGPSHQAQQLGQPEALTPAIQVRQLSFRKRMAASVGSSRPLRALAHYLVR